jgi:hypothetical protein
MATVGYMEQLTDPIFKLDAIVVNGDGEKAPFSLSIFYGGVEEKDICHYCWVRCPHIRKRDLKIFGVDDAGALAGAILFTETYLKRGGEFLINEDGEEVRLPPYEYAAEES